MDEPVSGCDDFVAQLLAAREDRLTIITALYAKHGLPVIILTLNIPGRDKLPYYARDTFAQGIAAVAGFDVVDSLTRTLQTGCEGFFAVNADPVALKRQLIDIETNHRLGRIFDFDVFFNGKILSRRQHQLPRRRCVLCGDNVDLCRREGRHSFESISRKLIDIYEGR